MGSILILQLQAQFSNAPSVGEKIFVSAHTQKYSIVTWKAGVNAPLVNIDGFHASPSSNLKRCFTRLCLRRRQYLSQLQETVCKCEAVSAPSHGDDTLHQPHSTHTPS